MTVNANVNTNSENVRVDKSKGDPKKQLTIDDLDK